jgi:hypothetical protein
MVLKRNGPCSPRASLCAPPLIRTTSSLAAIGARASVWLENELNTYWMPSETMPWKATTAGSGSARVSSTCSRTWVCPPIPPSLLMSSTAISVPLANHSP